MDDLENIIFQLISFSGAARSYIFEALKYCTEEKYDDMQQCMENAKEELLKAHNIQTGLIQKEAEGKHTEIRLLMVHAQDHLMTSLLAKDLVEQMIDMQKQINKMKKERE